MSQNRYFKDNLNWQVTLFLLVLFSSLFSGISTYGQNLFQQSQRLSQLAQSGDFSPTLIVGGQNVKIWRDGLALESSQSGRIQMDELGVYIVRIAGENPTHSYILQMGDHKDTLQSSRQINFYNKASYLYWESVGMLDTIDFQTGSIVACSTCIQNDTVINQLRRTYIKNTDPSESVQIQVNGNAIPLQASETFFYQVRGNQATIQIRGRRNQIEKPLQSLLKIWYQQVAYKDPNWRFKTLLDVREELMENPFFPNELARLVPQSSIEVSSYLPLTQRPKLQDWQKRLYETHEEIDVSIEPKLNFDSYNTLQISAPTQAAQQAQQVYASDQRLGLSLDQTAILRGLASFIEERAQEELNVAFLNRMKSRLEKDPILQTLFPYTTQLFDQIELDNYRFILDNAKVVFTTDLANLGLNIYNVFQVNQFQEEFEFSSGLYFTALVLKMINMVYDDVPTDTILVNSYLSLDNQALLLQKELHNRTARALLNDTLALQKIQKRTQAFFNQLDQQGQQLNQLISQVNEEVGALRDEIPYTNPLYEVSYQIGTNTQALRNNLSNWEKVLAKQKEETLINLYGAYPSTYILENSQLKNYETFFPASPIDTVALISKGLEKLNPGEISQNAYFLNDWLGELSDLQEQLLDLKGKWTRELDQRIENRALLITYTYQVLEQTLATEINWWKTNQSTLDRKPILALEFLQASLEQDSIIGNTYAQLKNALLQDKADFDIIRKLVPVLEIAFSNQYMPLLENNRKAIVEAAQKAKWKPQEIAPTFLANNVKKVRQAYPQFKSLYQAKEAAAEGDLDAFEQLLDSTAQFFEELPLEKVSSQNRVLENPYLDLLDTLLQYQYYDSLQAIQGIAQIGRQLDSFQISLSDLKSTGSELYQWIQTYQATNLDTSIIRSKNEVQRFSRILEVGVHLAQALKNNELIINSREIRDTTRSRITYELEGENGNIINLRDSLSINSVERIDTIKKKWLSMATLERTFKEDSLSRAIYFGLLYQDIASIPAFLKNSDETNPVVAQTVALLCTSILQGIESIYTIQEKKRQLKASGEKLSALEYTELIKGTLQIVGLTFQLFKQDQQTAQSPLLKAGEQILGQTSNLYGNLVEENYNLAISNLAGLVQALVSSNTSKGFSKGADKFKSKLLTYGSFMAAVSLAQTPDQVKTALETAAVDVGFSRVKRVNKWNVSVNAYLGVGFGYENRGTSQSGFQLNLATPIGLSFSKGIGKGHSLSAFGSILDLGPIVTFDFQSGSTFTDTKLSFGDFVAPGGFLFWNIANSPFTLGAGVQRTPKIRMLEGANEAQRYTRVLGSFLIDVPIFNLFTRKY